MICPKMFIVVSTIHPSVLIISLILLTSARVGALPELARTATACEVWRHFLTFLKSLLIL